MSVSETEREMNRVREATEDAMSGVESLLTEIRDEIRSIGKPVAPRLIRIAPLSAVDLNKVAYVSASAAYRIHIYCSGDHDPIACDLNSSAEVSRAFNEILHYWKDPTLPIPDKVIDGKE